jgi:hypothetical protein
MRQFWLETSANEIHTFLGRLETVRFAVPLPIPVSSPPAGVPAFRMQVAAAKMRATMWLGISISAFSQG